MNNSPRFLQRRSIRLKEWLPNQDTLQHPTPDYLAAANGTLADADYRLRTDANGFIVAPEATDEPADRALLFLGDSFVESVFVPEEERFPAAVQAQLRAAGQRVRCLNGGYSGATTLHMLLALLAKVGRARNMSVYLVVPSNDALALGKRGGYWCMTDKRYAPLVPAPRNVESGNQPIDLMDLRTVLNLFHDTCKRLRLPLTIATFPHRTASFDTDEWAQRRFRTPAGYARVLGWRKQVNDTVRAVATRLAVPLVDLDAAISTETALFYDDLHMNVAGSARVAALLMRQMAVPTSDQKS